MDRLWRWRAHFAQLLNRTDPTFEGGRLVSLEHAGETHARRLIALFWLSVIAVPASSLIIVVALSRHLAAGDLAKVSTIFSLSFVAAVLPMAAQSQAAADRASRGSIGRIHWPPLRITVIALAIAAPILARVVDLPLLAVMLPILAVLPAVAIGAARGELIATRSYRAATVNHVVDAVSRIVFGVGLGLAFGAAGVSAGLLVATAISWLALPILDEDPDRLLRLPTALIASALLTLSVQLDVLVAPRILGVGADVYAVAALPAKGVFLALMAAGWLVIPEAVGFRTVGEALKPLVLTVGAGVVLTLGAVTAAPIVGALLGRGSPDRALVLLLGLAMAAGAGNWVGLQIRLARAEHSLWPPATLAIVLTCIGGFASHNTAGLSMGLLVGQGLGLAITAAGIGRETVATAYRRTVADAEMSEPSPDQCVATAGARPLDSFVVTGDVIETQLGGADGPTAQPPQPRPNTTTAARMRPHPTRAAGPVDIQEIDGVGNAPRPCTRKVLSRISALLMFGCLVQHPGAIVPETKLDLTLDAFSFLGRTWHLWEPAADMGHVQNQAVGYLFPMGPFFMIGQLFHVPVWIIQRSWMALLLIMAFWGMARLADELEIGRPSARVIGALSYALSPFFIARVGITSAFVLGGTFLPWVLLPLVRASRAGSIRRGAALSGIAVFAIGGINGGVTLAVLIVPFLWLLTRARSRRRARLFGWWFLSVALASGWWLVPLLFQLRYGFNFLPFTERASTTTAYTAAPEVLRGTADWLSYLHLRDGWLPAGWDMVSEPIAIAGSVLVAAGGLFGLARQDIKHRSFLILSFLAGVAIVGAGYGGWFGNPLATGVRGLLDGPVALFRNIWKFQPLIALPISFGLIHSVELLNQWSESGSRGWRNARRRGPAFAAVGAVVVVLASASPLVRGQLTSDKGFREVPPWWSEVEHAQETMVRPGRALILPGIPTGDYTWGRTFDEPLQTMTDTPWALRSLIPLGGPGSTRVLDAVELAIERGGDVGLPSFLQRAGISYVIARNDVNWRDWNAPRPLQVHRALSASGLSRERSFGPTLPFDRDPNDPGFAVDGAEHDLHAIELYHVGSPTIVASYPVSTAAVLSGGPEAGLALARAGLDDRATILPGDVPVAAPGPLSWIITDTLRRRYVEFGLMRSNFSYTLGADEPAPDGTPLGPQLVPTPGTEHQTVARRTGIKSVRASSYGSWLYQIPEAAPANALDNDPATAWVAGPQHSSAGEWWRTDFLKPLDLTSIKVRLLADGSWRPQVTALRVTTEAGSLVTKVAPDESSQTISVPPGPSSWLKISFESVAAEDARSAGAGFREVTIPGVSVTSELVAPSEMTSQFSDPAATTPTYVFERTTADPRSLLRRDEETLLNRAFVVPHASDLTMTATATAVPGDPLFQLLHASLDPQSGDPQVANPPGLKPTIRVSASSTLSNLPEYDPNQLADNHDDTFWVAQPPDPAALVAPPIAGRQSPDAMGTEPRLSQASPAPQKTDPHPSVTFGWDQPRALESVVVTAAPGFSKPSSLAITGDFGTREATIDPSGTARFESVTTTALTVSFPEVTAQVSRNPLDGSLTTLPIGLAGLRFPALSDLALPVVPPGQPIIVACADGPTVTVDGIVHHFSITTTAAAVTSLTPVPITECGSDRAIAMTAGEHHLAGAPGRAPFNVTSLVMANPHESDSNKGLDHRGVRMVHWDNEDRSVQVDAGSPTYLAIDENFSDGWEAHLDGTALASVRLDGWRQGFVVPAGPGGFIDLHFRPGNPYRAGLVVGFLLILILFGLAFIGDRSTNRPGRAGEATIHAWVWVAIAGGGAVWIGGATAVLLLPLLWIAHRFPRGIPIVASGSMILSGVLVASGLGHSPGEHLGAFGPVAQILGGLAVLTIVASTLEPFLARRQRTAVVTPLVASTADAEATSEANVVAVGFDSGHRARARGIEPEGKRREPAPIGRGQHRGVPVTTDTTTKMQTATKTPPDGSRARRVFERKRTDGAPNHHQRMTTREIERIESRDQTDDQATDQR